jgi:hypothetical protein
VRSAASHTQLDEVTNGTLLNRVSKSEASHNKKGGKLIDSK